MNMITSPRKVYNTMAIPLERGIQRLLSNYVPAYYRGIGHPEIADACISIASAHKIPDMMDATLLASFCEPLILHTMTLHEEVEQIKKGGGETSREKDIEIASAEQAFTLLSATSRTVLSSCAFMSMGMYTSSTKGARSILSFVLEVTELAKLRELQGGYCPCGCTYPAGDEAFSPLKEQISAAVDIEIGLQSTDILETILRFESTQVVPDPREVMPSKLPDHRKREDPPMPKNLAGLIGMLMGAAAFAEGGGAPASAPAATEEVPPADDSAG